MEPLILRMLDISTMHMEFIDNVRLQERLEELCAYDLVGSGWLLYVGELDDNWPKEDWSAAFRKVLEWARDMNCDYVRFDRDGQEYEFLPTFDW